jgi:hypothetical protein
MNMLMRTGVDLLRGKTNISKQKAASGGRAAAKGSSLVAEASF